MSFASVLDSYCASLNCTNAAIAEECGVSASSLSRYRSGSRLPANPETVSDLARGISNLSKGPNAARVLSQDELEVSLEAARKGLHIVGGSFGERLDQLMSALGTKNNEIARIAQVDPSYISRIRSGERTPADRERMAEVCARFAAHWCVYNNAVDKLASVVKAAGETAEQRDYSTDLETALADDVLAWLLGAEVADTDIAEAKRLFDWLDGFDYEAFVREDDGVGEPVEPDLTPRSSFHYGVDDMCGAELGFLDIAYSTHVPSVILASDMPMLEMAVNSAFLELLLKRTKRLALSGVHVNVIHNVERSLSESIIILRDWLPLYMTGSVTSYYLRGMSNRVFYHKNYFCDSCIVSAEAVIGHQYEGRCYFSLLPEDIAYYRTKMDFIMERTTSLVEVFLGNRPGDFERFAEEERLRQNNAEKREVCAGAYENVRIVLYPGDCAVVSLSGKSPAHIVVRHPKLRYAISLMN